MSLTNLAGSRFPWSTILDPLERWNIEAPFNTAYVFLSDGEDHAESITYIELRRRALALAVHLTRETQRGQLALILLPSGIDFIVAFLGCLYAGVLAVPSPPPGSSRTNEKNARIRAIAIDSGATLALTTAKLRARIDHSLQLDAAIRYIEIDNVDPALSDGWDHPLPSPHDIAFVQYTSGSTSEPKGVIVTHANIAANEDAISRRCSHTANSTIGAWLPMFHDMGLIGTVLQPLYLGAKCVLISPTAFVQRPVRWLRMIQKYSVSSSAAPTFGYELCCRRITEEEREGLDLTSWRVAIAGAEPVREATLRAFAETFERYGFNPAAFFPSYGLAEATLMVTGGAGLDVRALSAERLRENQVNFVPDNGSVRICFVAAGSTVDSTTVEIREPDTDELCPPERIGQICVRGPGVTSGYWNKPQATDAIFGRDPAVYGSLFLRTGDLGFMDGDRLFITGRLKDLIIIRGRNHSPGDIECTIQACSSGLEGTCAAFSIDDGRIERLVIVQEIDSRIITRTEELALNIQKAVAIAHDLPVFEIAFARHGTIPKTTSGKIRRSACRQRYLDGSLNLLCKIGQRDLRRRPGSEAELPTDTAFDFIVQELVVLLDLDPNEIGPDTELFRLGVDSLTATELAFRIQRAFGIAFSLPNLQDGITVIELAELVDAASDDDSLLRHSLEPQVDFTRLSSDEQRLWLLHKTTPAPSAYNVSAIVAVKGSLDQRLLQESLNSVVARHPNLRATFQLSESGLVKTIASTAHLRCTFCNSGVPENDRESWLRGIALDEAATPFDLEKGPLIRFRLETFDPENAALIVAAHHIVCDAQSVSIFIDSLADAYQAISNGRDVTPVNMSTVGFVKQCERDISSVLEYWKSRLAPLPAEVRVWRDVSDSGALPTAATYHFEIGTATALSKCASFRRVSAFSVLLAILQIVLVRIAETDDVLIGVPYHGRTDTAASHEIGLFAHPLPIRTSIQSNMRFSDLTAKVYEALLEAALYQDVSLTDIIRAVNGLDRPMTRSLFQVLATYFRIPAARSAGPNTFQLLGPGRGTADADLSFVWYEHSHLVSCLVTYQPRRISGRYIQKIARLFSDIAKRVTQDPDLTIQTLLPPKEIEYRISITATFTAEPVQESIAFWLEKMQLTPTFSFAPLNQVHQQLLRGHSQLLTNRHGSNVFLVRLQDWDTDKAVDDSDSPELADAITQFGQALAQFTQRSETPAIVCFCPCSPDLTSLKAEIYQRLEQEHSPLLRSIPGVQCIPSKTLLEIYPAASVHDQTADRLASLPYTSDFFRVIGTSIARKLYNSLSPPYKVVAVDCDNTLWLGACAEEGPANITLDSARRELHSLLKAQLQAGRLLCICSKNHDKDVFEVFARNDFELTMDDFVACRVNWESKAANLRSLARELCLGPDSFIFLDDDPVECARMRVELPEVLTLQCPTDPVACSAFLRHAWVFDVAANTNEDRSRTQRYKDNLLRRRLEVEALTLDSFIEQLQLVTNCRRMVESEIARVSQLLFRVNQFNLTGLHLSEAEIRHRFIAGDLDCFVTEVRDRFGEYGIVGAMLCHPAGAHLELDAFVLSCRALGRKVENTMLERLRNEARARNLKEIQIHFLRTTRNDPALTFVSSVGHFEAEDLAVVPLHPPDVILTTELSTNRIDVPPTTAAVPAWQDHPALDIEYLAIEYSEFSKLSRDMEAWRRQRLCTAANPVDPLVTSDVASPAITSTEPLTSTEKTVAALWADTLGTEVHQVDIDFFALGGDSLKAVRLLSAIKQEFGVELPLGALFASSITIARIASLIADAQIRGADSSVLQDALSALQELSDEEVERLLTDRSEPSFGAASYFSNRTGNAI